VNKIYLRKFVGFFPSQDKSIVFFSISCLCCYFSVHDIYVNGNEVEEH
jgi:hypothetical protein